MTLAAGTRLGAYEILAPLGAGGMGEVYRARDGKLGREVAIKVLPAALAADAERLARFEKEARTASGLNHPNIVTIYDIGSADGVSYIAMELVEGKTLRELLVPGALPLKKLLPLSAQVASGLSRAHAAGIVHRDLKPENLMVTRDGLVKILDFGLAKLVSSGSDSDGTNLPTVTRGTEAGTVMGTVGYMSPEQASAEPVDFRSDQFAFGSILYEMVSGKRAFQRPTAAQTLSAIIEGEPEPLARLSPATPTNLIWIVERCLSKDPEDRYGSTKDLARDLATIRDHASGISVSGVEPPARRAFRLSRTALAATALAFAATAALTFFAGRRLQRRIERDAPPPLRQTLTFRRGFLTGARFAPDGQTIVYSAAWDGKPSEVFMTRVGSNESRPLGIFPAGILAISSTGEMAISLGCENRGDPCFGTVARAPLAGGAPREILESVGSADWSPDGKELAVSHVVNGRFRLEYPIGKVLHETDGHLSDVRVSPDGERVAFIDHVSRGMPGPGRLCVVDRQRRLKKLTDETATGPLLWSPAGDEVFFNDQGVALAFAGGSPQGRAFRRVTLEGRMRTASWLGGLDDVSREGMFLDKGGGRNFRGDVLGLVPGSPKEHNLSWFGDSHAADLSPDGRDLLFWGFGTGGVEFTTFLRRTDGSDAKKLGEGMALALSPDGKRALVSRLRPQPHLALLPTGAGEPKTLPGSFLQYHWATFFPDGRRILIAAMEKGQTSRSYIQNLEGGSPQPFAEPGMLATLVSPDGHEIAGTTIEGLQLIYRADGEGRPRAIEGALPDDLLVQWSADGKAIYVRGGEEGPLTTYRLDLATGRRDRWKDLAPPDPAGLLEYESGPKGVRITPDGRFYVYTYYSDMERLTLTDLGPNWWK